MDHYYNSIRGQSASSVAALTGDVDVGLRYNGMRVMSRRQMSDSWAPQARYLFLECWASRFSPK